MDILISQADQDDFFRLFSEHHAILFSRPEICNRLSSLPEDLRSGVGLLQKSEKELRKAFAYGDCPLTEILSLGVMFGTFFALNNYEPDFIRELSKNVGRMSVWSGRWKHISSLKKSLATEAATMWERGSQLLHNDMADELRKRNPDASKSISKPALLATLKPIAAKYGKVRGLKGVRKEKLPPK